MRLKAFIAVSLLPWFLSNIAVAGLFPIKVIKTGVWRVKYSLSSSSHLIAGDSNEGTLTLWSLEPKKALIRIKVDPFLPSERPFALSPSGRRIITTSEEGIKVWSFSGRLIKNFKREAENLVKSKGKLSFYKDRAKFAVFSDGQTFATLDPYLKITHLNNSDELSISSFPQKDISPIEKFYPKEDRIGSLHFSADGKKIIAAHYKCQGIHVYHPEVLLWDVKSGALEKQIAIKEDANNHDALFKGFQDEDLVREIQVKAIDENHSLALVSFDYDTCYWDMWTPYPTLRVVNLETGDSIQEFIGTEGAFLNALNALIIRNRNDIEIWRKADDKFKLIGKAKVNLKSWGFHEEELLDMALSNDEKILTASSNYGNIYIWKTKDLIAH